MRLCCASFTCAFDTRLITDADDPSHAVDSRPGSFRGVGGSSARQLGLDGAGGCAGEADGAGGLCVTLELMGRLI